MKVIYAKTLTERILDEIDSANAKDFEIEKILITEDEAKKLYRENVKDRFEITVVGWHEQDFIKRLKSEHITINGVHITIGAEC